MEITRDNLLSLIQSGMKREGLGLLALEKRAGVPKDTVRDFLRGKTHILRADKLQKILGVLGKVTVTGIAGEDAEILPVSESEKAGEVDCPPGFDPWALNAVRVRGDAMAPVFLDGWTVYYTRRKDTVIGPARGGWQVPYNRSDKKEADGPMAEFINKPCVIRLKDGRLMLRTLKRGTRAGRYHLISYNSRDIENAEIESVSKIVFIKTE